MGLFSSKVEKPNNNYDQRLSAYSKYLFDVLPKKRKAVDDLLKSVLPLTARYKGGAQDEIDNLFEGWNKNVQAKKDIEQILKDAKKVLDAEQGGIGEVKEAVLKVFDGTYKSFMDGGNYIYNSYIPDNYKKTLDFRAIFRKKTDLNYVHEEINGIIEKLLKNEFLEDKKFDDTLRREIIAEAREEIVDYFDKIPVSQKVKKIFENLHKNILSTVDSAYFFHTNDPENTEEVNKNEIAMSKFIGNITNSMSLEAIQGFFEDLYSSTNNVATVKDNIKNIIKKTPALAPHKKAILNLFGSETDLTKLENPVFKAIDEIYVAIPVEKRDLLQLNKEQAKTVEDALGVMNEDWPYDGKTHAMRSVIRLVRADLTRRNENTTLAYLDEVVNDLEVRLPLIYQEMTLGKKERDAFALKLDKKSGMETNGFYQRYVCLEHATNTLTTELLQIDSGVIPDWAEQKKSKWDEQTKKLEVAIEAMNLEMVELREMAEKYEKMIKLGDDAIDKTRKDLTEEKKNEKINKKEEVAKELKIKMHGVSTKIVKTDEALKELDIIPPAEINALVKTSALKFNGSVHSLLEAEKKNSKEVHKERVKRAFTGEGLKGTAKKLDNWLWEPETK